MIALNYGAITMIDDWVGRILDALEQAGKAENTVVVFMSDHGDYMGDHGTVLKHGLHSHGADPRAADLGRSEAGGRIRVVAAGQRHRLRPDLAAKRRPPLPPPPPGSHARSACRGATCWPRTPPNCPS